MVEKKVIIQNEHGLHARPAAIFAKEALKYKSKVVLLKNNQEYNAKSTVSIMTMGIMQGDEVVIRAIGPDEQEAVEALANLLEKLAKEEGAQQ